MKKLYFTIFLLFFGLLVQAQNISVADFYYAESDLTARTHGTSMEDQNGNICALIKVETTEKGLWLFDVGMLGVTKTEMQNAAHPAEIWVYVPFSVTWISIQHEQLGKMSRYAFPCSIDKGCTYVMKLTTGKVTTIVEEEVREQYLTFQITPANALLEVDGKLWEVGPDGSSTKFVSFGAYNYRVQAANYHTEVGKVTVNDPEKAHKVTVNLKPDFVEVTLKVDADAEIWVNNEKKGVGTWTGNLGKGSYKMECKQANHEATVTTQEITEAMNGQTITLAAPKPFYGSLNIESTPNYAQIYIDGKAMGETPKFVKEILVGTHELKLTKEGYADYVESIILSKGERKQVNATMSSASYNFSKGKEFYDKKEYAEALTWFNKAVEQGDSDAQYYLGEMYRNGRGVTKDVDKALKCFQNAAEKGSVEAQVALGHIYLKGYEKIKYDYSEAYKWFLKAAEKGSAEAQNMVGEMYFKGQSVNKDYDEAIKWYRKAVGQGDSEAQYNLGFMYQCGFGVTKDYAEALNLFRQSAAQNNPQGLRNLGIMYYYGFGVEKNETEAKKWLNKAAENADFYSGGVRTWRDAIVKGDASAQYSVALNFEFGSYVERDLVEYEKWMRKSAEQNYPLAQHDLAFDYYLGDGPTKTKDYVEAEKWCLKLTEGREGTPQHLIIDAQEFLGHIYRQGGNGITADYAKALKWYRMAADQGSGVAQCWIGIMYYRGNGVDKDYGEAVKWLRMSAHAEKYHTMHASALDWMGWMYQNGYGVNQDNVEAVNYYRQGAEKGGASAQYHLGTMYETGKGVEKSKEEAVKWYKKAANQGNEKAKKKLLELG
jgi:TPR repeat protein